MKQSELDAALERLIDGLSDRDLGATLSCFSASDEPAVLGSEAGEAAIGRVHVERFFQHLYSAREPFRFDFPARRWRVRGEVAWLTADGTVDESASAPAKPYRLTAVFVREDDAWKLALWSGSEPV